MKLQEKIKELLIQYTDLINENQFRDLLLRIFKKKFKQSKGSDESFSSSSATSSESSSDENDAATINSLEIRLFHINENVLPTGCDEELYNMAFTLREHRYKYEFQIKEQYKKIEGLYKDLDIENKKLKVVENELKSSQQHLEAFIQEKQDKLNGTDVTIVLKFNQLQYFLPNSENMAKIKDCVLFEKENLSRLYTRVKVLLQETSDQLINHKKNQTHLRRMKIDCKHMEAEITQLKANIKCEIIKKFGQEISVDALYEAVLRSLIYYIKANISSITISYKDQIKCVRNSYKQNVDVLRSNIQDNTEKLSFLTVLEEEHMKLRKLMKLTPIFDVKYSMAESQYLKDTVNLENVLKNQVHQRELFRDEARYLSMKSNSLVPICLKGKIHHLISKINQSSLDNEELREELYQMLKKIILNLPPRERIENLRTNIEKIVEKLVQNISHNEQQTAEIIRQVIQESCYEIL